MGLEKKFVERSLNPMKQSITVGTGAKGKYSAFPFLEYTI
jgi:hypothetical protein